MSSIKAILVAAVGLYVSGVLTSALNVFVQVQPAQGILAYFFVVFLLAGLIKWWKERTPW